MVAPAMRFAVLVTPFFNESAIRFIAALLDVPNLRLAVVSQDVEENLPEVLLGRLVKHFRVSNVQDTAELVAATRWLHANVAPVDRLLGVSEFVQVAVAEARDALGLPGPGAEVIRNFRDKPRMKDVLRAAGLPCARHCLAPNEDEARRFAAEVGFPLVAKPPAGVGSASTFVVKDAAELDRVLAMSAPIPASPVMLEEFVRGAEHTFDAVVIGGKPVWYSISRYLPNPIEVVENPWIQWCVLLPRDIGGPEFAPIRELGFRALSVLGLETGICHMEWFRQDDGRIVLSEVAARPGGAQLMNLNARAHDFDMYGQVARLIAFDTFEAPRERKYATGAAFLRGQAPGVVREVWGIEEAERKLGRLITDVKWPKVGEPRSASYEGEGYVLVRHPETEGVAEALREIVQLVRVVSH